MEKLTGLLSRRYFFDVSRPPIYTLNYTFTASIFHRAPRASGGVKPFIKFITEKFTLYFFERKYFCHLFKITVTAQMSFSLTGVSTSKATSADVSASLIHLFASFSPLVEILQGEIFCLFPQNATQQFTSGASKKSLASAPGRRPTVATLW